MFQEVENGLDHLVSVFSKWFDQQQVNLSTIEKGVRYGPCSQTSSYLFEI